MDKINWFINKESLPTQNRSDVISKRATITDSEKKVIRSYGEDYYDGKGRIGSFGYGGYYYDGRFKTVVSEMIEHYGLDSESKILDIGGGKNFLIYEFYKAGIKDVYGVEISEYAVEHTPAEIRENCFVGTATDLSRWPDNYFDLILSKDCLHNVPPEEIETSIKEIVRVSKGPGFLQINSYETPNQKKCLKTWVITIKTVMSANEWVSLLANCDYKGDYYFLTFDEKIGD